MDGNLEKALQAQDELRSLMTPNQRVIIPTQGGEIIREEGATNEPKPKELSFQQMQADPTVGAGIDNANKLPDPTPQSPVLDQLNARAAQAEQSMKDNGFDGYLPDLKDANVSPEDQSRVMQAVTDFAAGFNTSLAKGLSLPRETVDRGMAMLGLDYMQSGSPTQHTIDALNRMGIKTYEVESLANKIGQGSLPAIATWGAMVLAAPELAAAQGTGMLPLLGKGLGEWLTKHPVAAFWFGQTGNAGGETAVHMTGNDNMLTRMGGELAAGALPSAVRKTAMLPLKLIPGSTTAFRMGTQAVGKGINAISDALPQDLGNVVKKYNPLYKQISVPRDPLVNQNFNPDRLNTFAQDQLLAAQHYQDLAIERAIQSVPKVGEPAQLSKAMHDRLLEAEKISKNIVSSFWKRVPLKSKMDVSELRQDVIKFRNSLADLDNQRPDEMIQKVMDTVRLRQEPGSGRFVAPTPTLQKMRDLQSQIGRAITLEKANDAPREGMIRRLVELSELIDNNIANAFPNSTTIQQARAMSKSHNDLFSRGPVDAILSKRRSGDFRTAPEDAVAALTSRTEGLSALYNVRDSILNYPTARFVKKINPAEEDTLHNMIKSAQDAIRSEWRNLAEQNPNKAIAFSQRNEDQIKAIGDVAGELQFAGMKVKAAIEARDQITKSALARFAATDAEKAVSRIFADKNPAQLARDLMIHFRGDPDALEGLQNQVLKEFIYNRAKTNPNVMREMLDGTQYGDLMRATLSNEQYARLSKMVNTAVRLGAENEATMKSAFRAPFSTVGRIIGAHIGRQVAPGTIQGPGIFANIGKRYMERIFQSTDPEDLLARAVVDPNWERLLYSRIPETTADMQSAKTTFRRIFASVHSAEQRAIAHFSKSEDNADE